MMRTMRSFAKWIMAVVAVAFVGFMIFEVGMDATGRGSSRGQSVARVNGRAIDNQMFQEALRNEYDRLRGEGGQAPVTLEGQRQLEDQVLEQLIQQVILQQEYRRRGIRVSDEEVIAAARTTPPPEVYELEVFQTDGQFDLAKYQRYLSSAADPQFLLALEGRYREEIPRIKLIQQVTAGVHVSDGELWQQWRDRHDSVTAELVTLYPALAIPDSAVTLTDADLRRWYRDNRESLRRPAQAFMSYLTVPRAPNAADTAAAATRAAEVHAQLVAGADFAELAASVSADSGSGAQGGDLGEQPLGVFVPEFEQAARALRPGQMSAPVASPFGWHIIRLDARTDSTFRAAHILIPVEPAGDHLEFIERRADSLDILAAEQDDGTALDRIAQDMGSPVLVAPSVRLGERLDLNGEYLGDPSVWAFGPDGVVGSTSPVIETPAAYYVFRLDSMYPEGVPPYDAVAPEVRRAATLAAKRALAREAAASLVNRARGAGGLLEHIGDLLAVPNTIGPFPRIAPPPALQGAPAVVGVAFGLGVGQVSDPVVTETAVHVVRVTRKVLADSTAWRAQLVVQRAQALQQARQIRVQAVFASLRQAARVEDYRDELARLAREQDQVGGMPGNPFGF